MPKTVPIGDAVMNLGSLTLLLHGLRTGREDLISEFLQKYFHHYPDVLSTSPEISTPLEIPDVEFLKMFEKK